MMRIRTVLAAMVAVPALVLAPVAQAKTYGLIVTLTPNLGGMQVVVTDTLGVAQQCRYNAQPLGNPLLTKPTERQFGLGPNATVTMQFPGIPTGTEYRVIVFCDRTGPGEKFAGGVFDEILTY